MSSEDLSLCQQQPSSAEANSRELNRALEVILPSLEKNLGAASSEGDALEIIQELRRLVTEIRVNLRHFVELK